MSEAKHLFKMKLAPWALLTVAMAWGWAFVIMKDAIQRQSVNNFLFTRFLLGNKYGRKLFDRPEGRFFNHQKVVATEKWLRKYGPGKAIVLARFVPFIRTLLNPMCGVIGMSAKKFFVWNVVGAIIWTQLVIGLGFILGEKLEGSVDAYILPIVGLIVVISLLPVLAEVFREWQTRKHHK